MADFTPSVREARAKYWDKFCFSLHELNEHLRLCSNAYWANNKDKDAIAQALALLEQADIIMTARYYDVLGDKLIAMRAEQLC